MKKTWETGIVFGIFLVLLFQLMLYAIVSVCRVEPAIDSAIITESIVSTFTFVMSLAVAVFIYKLFEDPIITKPEEFDFIPEGDFIDIPIQSGDEIPSEAIESIAQVTPTQPPAQPVRGNFDKWMVARRKLFMLEKHDGDPDEIERMQQTVNDCWNSMDSLEQYRAGIEEADFWKYTDD